jgi:alginate O-acetyltransferase complex protein AlgI
MLFNSYTFIFLFLPIVLGGYALACRIGTRAGMAWLVVASLFFYGWWNPVYLWLILGSVGVNYFFGCALTNRPTKRLLALGVCLNLGLIGYFKYAGFFGDMYSSATGIPFEFGDILLPLGISFFTFQQIAYLVDSYQGRTVRHGWLEYILYVTFFPQLIAGPIVHQAEILPQFLNKLPGIKARHLAIGATIFIIGLFKKVVIADNLAFYVTPMFDAAARGEVITFLEAWGGSLAYTFQLYFDFSGYSDMAIGLARMFGVTLPINFNSPYKATSIIDFWRRWHLTLSRFLRDYLYIPLGGNNRGNARRYANLLIVMLLGGLWHGAGWTFIFWGGLHGFYLIINHLWRAIKRRVGLDNKKSNPFAKSASWSLTFLSVVIGWVFFRSASWDAATNILHAMTGLDGRLLVTVGYVPILEPLSFIIGPLNVTETVLPYFQGREQLAWIGGCLFLALALPNTQEWMSRYIPSLKKPILLGFVPRFVLWRPTPIWALISITLLSLSIVFALQPSEFLYYQF